jgi:uncharacterized membrane protein HdeD (DUF308 family)
VFTAAAAGGRVGDKNVKQGQRKPMNSSATDDQEPSDQNVNDKPSRAQNIVFLLLLIRGTLAIVLGLILIFNPDKSRQFLFNFMGIFWLTTGLALIRQGVDSEVGSRSSKIIGLVAVLTGLFVLTRDIARDWLPEGTVVQLLGTVILLTGVLHILSEFRVGRWTKRGITWAHFFLGVFEIVLGATLLLSPLDQGPIVYWTATLWALVGGALIIGGALYNRFLARRERKVQQQPGIE